ncbi:MAG: methyltransferase [Lachnospiraceae bacterium]|nr:methyltransferase [Lachnospiraceae bacterium]
MLDLCTGNGIIPLLLSAKTDAKYIVGMEIQPDVAEMAKRSVKMNALDNKIEILTSDIKKAAEEISVASFDVVTVNPPYFKKGHGITNPNDTKTIARHEISCTLKDILEAASFALRPGGSLYMVHKPQRLTDVIYEMRSLRIEPKVLKLVYPYVSSEPSMFLIEGKKDGNPEIRIEKPLIIYGEDGNYTEEMYTIYGY